MGEHHAEPYVRFLHEYLLSKEWMQNVTLFLNSNCHAFVGADAASEREEKAFVHEQHDTFLCFQTWLEDVLLYQLDQLGVTTEELVPILEDARGDPGMRERVDQLLELIDSFASFERFCERMEERARTLESEDAQQSRVLQLQLDMKSWDLQLALAMSLKDSGGTLTDDEAVLLPWADAVIELQRVLERAGAPGNDPTEEENDIAAAQQELKEQRLQVEYMVANRLEQDNNNLRSALRQQQPQDSAAGDGEGTTLSRLLHDSGVIQLAIGQQRALLNRQDVSMLSDSEYEQVYFAVRDEARKQAAADMPRLERTLMGRIPALRGGMHLLQQVEALVRLEDRLRRVHRDIEQELREPGTVTYMPDEVPNNLLSVAKMDTLRRQDSLQKIATYLGTPKSPPAPGGYGEAAGAAAAADANAGGHFGQDAAAAAGGDYEHATDDENAMQRMQDDLRAITQQREVENLRLKMQGQTGARDAERLASRAAQLEAMAKAEAGQAVLLPVQWDNGGGSAGTGADGEYCGGGGGEDDYDWGGADFNPYGGSSSDDETEEEDTEEGGGAGAQNDGGGRGTGLRIRATQATTPAELLRETERLRKQLLLRGSPTAMGSKNAFVQLNSPKRAAPPGAAPAGVIATPTHDLSVNPTTLRFLASNIKS